MCAIRSRRSALDGLSWACMEALCADRRCPESSRLLRCSSSAHAGHRLAAETMLAAHMRAAAPCLAATTAGRARRARRVLGRGQRSRDGSTHHVHGHVCTGYPLCHLVRPHDRYVRVPFSRVLLPIPTVRLAGRRCGRLRCGHCGVHKLIGPHTW